MLLKDKGFRRSSARKPLFFCRETYPIFGGKGASFFSGGKGSVWGTFAFPANGGAMRKIPVLGLGKFRHNLGAIGRNVEGGLSGRRPASVSGSNVIRAGLNAADSAEPRADGT
jgi:hypothetical protein